MCVSVVLSQPWGCFGARSLRDQGLFSKKALIFSAYFCRPRSLIAVTEFEKDIIRERVKAGLRSLMGFLKKQKPSGKKGCRFAR
jgi:hypothetical protein